MDRRRTSAKDEGMVVIKKPCSGHVKGKVQEKSVFVYKTDKTESRIDENIIHCVTNSVLK